MTQDQKPQYDDLIIWASEQASSLLSPLGSRWLHVQGVVQRAQRVKQCITRDDQHVFIASAYLHDIGYAPSLKKTGFHPLDGALYLRSLGYERLASIVAYHSEARFEALLRGLLTELRTFPCEISPLTDALTYCDMTTGPQGDRISFEERIADIQSRYDENAFVIQALRQAIPAWIQAIERTQQRLKECAEKPTSDDGSK